MGLSLGLGFLSGNSSTNSILLSLINDFKLRVTADSGTFEAEISLLSTLNNLNNI